MKQIYPQDEGANIVKRKRVEDEGNPDGGVSQWNVLKKVKVSRTDTKIDLPCYIFILNSLSLRKSTKYIIFHTMFFAITLVT